MLYFAALALFVASLFVNIESLAGQDLLMVLFKLKAPIFLLTVALTYMGFGFPTRGWINFTRAPSGGYQYPGVGLSNVGRYLLYASAS
jgi:hypothetical protein